MKQSVIAGHVIVKIEDILKKCGLENVLVTVNDKEYVALDEVKKAIRVLYEEEQHYALQSNMDNVFHKR